APPARDVTRHAAGFRELIRVMDHKHRSTVGVAAVVDDTNVTREVGQGLSTSVMGGKAKDQLGSGFRRSPQVARTATTEPRL
ncbi:MAG: hypothetical protein ABSG36_19615, partial [Acidimicrobiales bacterium]